MKQQLLLGALTLVFATGAIAADLQSKDLPPAIQALSANGISIDKTMQAPDGFKGYVGVYQGRKMPIYLLPDKKHVPIGSLFDAKAQDLTSVSFSEASKPVYGKAEWQKLENATWIAQGAKNPERIVYAFTDTECPYCHQLWQDPQPLLKNGKTQIRHVIVAVISAKSAPRAAAILNSDDRDAALQTHEKNFGHSPFPDSGEASGNAGLQLAANGELMNSLGIFSTPALVYHDADARCACSLAFRTQRS